MRKIILTLALCIACGRADAQWVLLHSDADSIILHGVEQVFNLRYDSAEASFSRVVTLYPSHPAGYFFLAMVDWWRIAVDPDNTTWDSRFRAKLQRTIDLCDTLLDSNEFDIQALFFKGGAIGYLGEIDAYREQWLAAAQQGKSGLDILDRVSALAPTNYDLMLGLGLYNYYAEKIPEEYPFVKPLLLFFPPGSKSLGLQQLRAAATKARYARYEAMYQLLRVYYGYEKDYGNALVLAKQLSSQFPDNVLFERYLGRAYVQQGLGWQWDSTWRDVITKVRLGRPGYSAGAAREGHYYIAMYAMNRGLYDEALANLYICDSLSRPLDSDGPSGFMVLTNLRIGMIYDMQRKREYAMMQYEKVLSWKDYGDAHVQAERYREHPYGQ
jgi:hypothetical protein